MCNNVLKAIISHIVCLCSELILIKPDSIWMTSSAIYILHFCMWKNELCKTFRSKIISDIQRLSRLMANMLNTLLLSHRNKLKIISYTQSFTGKGKYLKTVLDWSAEKVRATLSARFPLKNKCLQHNSSLRKSCLISLRVALFRWDSKNVSTSNTHNLTRFASFKFLRLDFMSIKTFLKNSVVCT